MLATEAFAAQSLAVIRELGLDQAKVNPLGGAIALCLSMAACSVENEAEREGLQSAGGLAGGLASTLLLQTGVSNLSAALMCGIAAVFQCHPLTLKQI